MLEDSMKKLLCLVLLLIITSAQAGEKLDVIGTIFYSETLKAFSMIYLKDEKPVSHFIEVKNQSEFQQLKTLIGKSIRVEGELNWKQSSNETFSLKEELSISKISDFELKHTALSAKENQFSNDFKFEPSKLSSTIGISDKTANTALAISVVALGVATGPLILVPLAFYGLTELFTL